MNLIDRYTARNVLAAMLVVQVLLMGLDLVINYISGLEDVENHYGAFEVLLYTLMRLPWRFYQYAPVGVLLGGLIGLGAMASNNELTTMRAAGWSLARIIWAVMKPLGVVILLTMVVGEYVAPSTEQYAKSWRAEQRQGDNGLAEQDGGWQREGNDFYRFASMRSDNTVIGVLRYHFDGQRLESALHAERAVPMKGGWQLQNVQETHFEPDRTVTDTYASEPWRTSLDPKLLKQIITDQDSQSISDLWRYGRYLNAQGTDATDTWLYFWQKLLQPLVLAGLMLVAASFVFGPLRTAAAGTRVFYGTLVGLSFKYLQDLLGPASTIFGFSPVWAVLTPTLACFLVGFFLLRRAE